MYKRTDELNCKQPKNRHMEGSSDMRESIFTKLMVVKRMSRKKRFSSTYICSLTFVLGNKVYRGW